MKALVLKEPGGPLLLEEADEVLRSIERMELAGRACVMLS